MKNELKTGDFNRLVEFFKENLDVSVELSTNVDFEFVSVSPIIAGVEGFGFKLSTKILFEQPIGFEVYDTLKLDDEMRSCFAVNRENFELSKIVIEATDLEKDLNMFLKIIERTVNHVCNRFGRLVEQTFTINSEGLDRQLGMMLRAEELEKRGEIPRPFGTIHAKSSKDAKERAGELVPIYFERDKAYLYEDKKVFILLPRNFIMKLLKLKGSTMVAADQFTEQERQVLNNFAVRRYIKTRKVGGKVHYCDLDGTTLKLLVKGMRRR